MGSSAGLLLEIVRHASSGRMSEVHANKCVYPQVINERNGVGNMGAGDYDRERIRPSRTEGKSVCPAETGLLGNLGGMGKRLQNMGFEHTKVMVLPMSKSALRGTVFTRMIAAGQWDAGGVVAQQVERTVQKSVIRWGRGYRG